MNRILALLLALGLPLVILGCGGPGGHSSEDDSDSSTGDDDDDDDGNDHDNTGGDGDTTSEANSSVSGTVTDSSGEPLEGIAVTCCSDERCINGTTDASGAFTISNLTENVYVIDNLSFPEGGILGWSKFFEFVTVGADDAATIDYELVLPRVTETVSGILDTAADFTFGDGLQVTYDGSVAELPLAAQSEDYPTLGVVAVPEAQWPLGGLGDWTIVQAWAFAPFEVELKSGSFAITAPLDTAIATGTEVGLLWADYSEGIVTETFMEAEATLSADGLSVEGSVHSLSLLLVATRES